MAHFDIVKKFGVRSIATAFLGTVLLMEPSIAYAQYYGQSNPSFKCAKATTSNELLICRHGELGTLDRQVSTAYKDLTSSVSRAAHQVIKKDQRAWLNARQKCHSNLACTRNSYTQRLSYLKSQLAPYKNPTPPAYTPSQPPSFQPTPPNTQQPPSYNPTPTPSAPPQSYQPTPPPSHRPTTPQGNSPPPYNGNPTPATHFKQPVFGQSLGGIVREGPGINYRRLHSYRAGRPISILANSGVRMNGYDWFQISLGGNRTAYQWGGIMCSNGYALKGINRICGAPRQPTYTPPPARYNPTTTPPRPNQPIAQPPQNNKTHGQNICGLGFTYVGFNSGYRANLNGCYRTSLMNKNPITGKPELCGPGFAHLGKNEACKNIKQWNADQKRKANWPKCPKDFHFVQGRGCTHQSQLGE